MIQLPSYYVGEVVRLVLETNSNMSSYYSGTNPSGKLIGSSASADAVFTAIDLAAGKLLATIDTSTLPAGKYLLEIKWTDAAGLHVDDVRTVTLLAPLT
jgi:hypothetical protein